MELQDELSEIAKRLKEMRGGQNKEIVVPTKDELMKEKKEELCRIVIQVKSQQRYSQQRVFEYRYEIKRLLQKIRKLLVEKNILEGSKSVRSFAHTRFRKKKWEK